MKHTRLSVMVLLMVGAASFVWLVRSAWDWSERFMAPVRTGMTMADIRSLLGPPRAVRNYGGEIQV